MDAEILKALKEMREQINDLVVRAEENLIDKHNENSEAIDDIVISMIGGGGNV